MKKAYDESEMRTRQKRIVTPGEPKGVKQHHWNTGAKENTSWTANDQATDKTKSSPNQLYVGPITESDARPTGVQLKREAKLLAVIGLITEHADCRITFVLYPIRL